LETKGFIIEGLPTTKGADNNWCLDVALSVCERKKERKGERKRKGEGKGRSICAEEEEGLHHRRTTHHQGCRWRGTRKDKEE
jgi:hypothetical protein